MQKQTQKVIWVILAMAAACGGAATTAGSPTADAGPDQAVASGALVTLDGSASSGVALRFAWTQTLGPSVALSASSAKAPTFIAPTIGAGQPPVALEFTLVVSNANGTSGAASAAVTVSAARPASQAPAANAGSNQAVASGGAVVLDGSASPGAVSFAWTQTSGPAVALSGANTARATFAAPAVSAPATLVFSLTVADAQGNSSSATVTVTVNPPGANFPPPPGTPPPAAPNPTPLPVGGNGSHRFQIGTQNGLYLQDPTPGEPTVQGFVVVTLGAAGGGLPGNAPADTVLTINGVPLLRDPKLDGNFFRVDPAGPQPRVGWGGDMVIVAKGTDPKTGDPIQRQLVLPCASDIAVSSTPPIGSSLAATSSVTLTSPSNISLNVGVPIAASFFPQATLFGYAPASGTLAPSGSPHNIGAGPVNLTVPVLPTTADAYLLDLRWPGVYILDGQTGGFCGLAKRWTYAK